MKEQFELFRPKEFTGSGDKHLFALINELSKLIIRLEKRYYYNTLKFDANQNFIMANLLIELAEDLHNDIGLWKSIEQYNKTLFNTPLPLFVDENTEIQECFDKNRIKFFIYNIIVEFDENVILSPQHKDLEILARGVSQFLEVKFKAVPKESGVKLFLHQKDEYGWDFKSKLVWASLGSYLFRSSCYSYAVKKNLSNMDIETVDDFICQESSVWSGLTVVDIVAKALELPEKLQQDVLSWNERLVSIYRVISFKNDIFELENIINEQIYKVQSFKEAIVFKKNHFVLGGLVPYGEYYYWSGVQRDLGKMDSKTITNLKNDFVLKSTRIVYRYDKKLLNRALESIKVHYADFKSYFNTDLVYFKDGISMAAALQNKDKQKYDALSKEDLKEVMKKHNLKNPFPNMHLSKDLLQAKNGLGVFFNPNEGTEIMMDFDDITNGFRKKGVNLTKNEKSAIQQFIFSSAISPNFVLRMIADYGEKSIASAFVINNDVNCTSFLLHKYKGHFYKNRYPEISLKID
ncbi:MAG: DUF3843 family protein [Paludibacter sp.]|nr:DUF3843 family protein [Paludibacter sp.]